jgi:predicted small lipoprotein YifL
MSLKTTFVLMATVVVMAGCGSTKPAGTSTAANNAKPEQTTTGTIVPGSKFSKIKVGMQFSDVTNLIGAPNDITRHETGKRWIPFYFGSDVQRMQALYKGEGCLTFTGGNQFGGGGGDLLFIAADTTGGCWK